MKTLAELGWSPWFSDRVASSDLAVLKLGRVTEHQKGLWQLTTPDTVLQAEVSGRFGYISLAPEDYPAVGDYVLFRREQEGPAIIERVIDRRTCLWRKAAGRTSERQIIAANMDEVWIVTSMNQELKLRRIERYLTLVRSSGAAPVVLLTKADICQDRSVVDRVRSVAGDARVLVVSAISGEGLDAVRSLTAPGKTIAIAGSSGVGKSTLINRLSGQEQQAVLPTREADDKGRHTTTSRSLIFLPGGGMVIDTPGMRELGLSDAAPGMEEVFDEIEALAKQCRYNNCSHSGEPECAVQKAISQGQLETGRLESLRKQQRELRYQEQKQSSRARIDSKKRWKNINKEYRQLKKHRDKP